MLMKTHVVFPCPGERRLRRRTFARHGGDEQAPIGGPYTDPVLVRADHLAGPTFGLGVSGYGRCPQHDLVTRPEGEGSGVRFGQGADPVGGGPSWAIPVRGAHLGSALAEEFTICRTLAPARCRPGQYGREVIPKHGSPGISHPGGDGGAGISRMDRHSTLVNDVTGVCPGIEIHHRVTSFSLTPENGPVHRGAAAETGQEGRVESKAATWG